MNTEHDEAPEPPFTDPPYLPTDLGMLESLLQSANKALFALDRSFEDNDLLPLSGQQRAVVLVMLMQAGADMGRNAVQLIRHGVDLSQWATVGALEIAAYLDINGIIDGKVSAVREP